MIDQLSNAKPGDQPDNLSETLPNVLSLPPAPPWPWKNMGIWRIMTWMLSGSRQKSEAEVTCLVHEVINSDDFNRRDFSGFNAHTQTKLFNQSENLNEHSTTSLLDGWKESSVDISVPT